MNYEASSRKSVSPLSWLGRGLAFSLWRRRSNSFTKIYGKHFADLQQFSSYTTLSRKNCTLQITSCMLCHLLFDFCLINEQFNKIQSLAPLLPFSLWARIPSTPLRTSASSESPSRSSAAGSGVTADRYEIWDWQFQKFARLLSPNRVFNKLCRYESRVVTVNYVILVPKVGRKVEEKV